MADVFLSYAREDRETAQRVARLLEANGLTVWWDKAMIAGADINEAIDKELDAAKAVIVLWSPHSVTSHWVRGEAQTAVDANKLVPIEVAPCKLPINFRHFHTPAVHSDAGALDELAGLLSQKLAGQTGQATPTTTAAVRFKPETKESFRGQFQNVILKPDRSFWRQMERETEFTRKHPLKVIGATLACYLIAVGFLHQLGMPLETVISAASFLVLAVYFAVRAYLLRQGK
jgi:hypothetical protein